MFPWGGSTTNQPVVSYSRHIHQAVTGPGRLCSHALLDDDDAMCSLVPRSRHHQRLGERMTTGW